MNKLKHYWIFLVTIIFYCIGFAVHFIAQHGGTHAHRGKEVLKEATSYSSTIIDANLNSINNTTSFTNDTSTYTDANNIFYFAQISDIHMSLDYSRGSQGHLYFFLKKLIPMIEPHFLFITGDITNSKKYGGIAVGTNENEWKMYRKIIENTEILTKNNGTFLWDLRGNHDCFMVPEWKSDYNYFKDYSKTQSRGFTFNYETSYGTYSFVGLDGCPIYTAANPFFGIVDEVTMDMYSQFMDKAKSNPNNKHNFVFIHYPETTAKFGKSSSGKRWEDYTKDISLLLSGHFHNLVGEYIYAYHHNYLELELNDMKLHGKYRIVAVDHDVVSITDNTLPLPALPYDFQTADIDELINHPPLIFNQEIPPIVHITSPKNSRFILKSNEPVMESLTSGYVRVLVFSSRSPSDLELSLYIDNQLQPVTFNYVGQPNNLERRSEDKVHVSSTLDKDGTLSHTTSTNSYTINFKTAPLWVAQWENSQFKDGKSHELKVVATDKTNQQKGENTISFRLDGQRDELGIPFRGIFLLKTVFVKSLPILFGIVYIIYELIILLSRLYAVKNILPYHTDLPFLPNKYINDEIFNETKPFHDSFFKRNFVLPFIEAFTFNGIFYPLQILVICILVFPSKIGLISRSSENISRFGGEFLYGFFGSGQWANTFDQYGIFTVLFLLIPFFDTCLIAFLNHKRKRSHIITIILLVVIGLFQFLITFSTTFMRGGILTVLLSPFPVWIYLYSWFLIILIEIRRMKRQESKPVTPELTPELAPLQM